VAALKPPVHFRSVQGMQDQLRRWSPDTLGKALDLLLEAEIDCKTTGLPAAEICGRAVMSLARAAGRSGRRR